MFVKHAVSGWSAGVSMDDGVYGQMLHKALGFFGSKVINHKRKATQLPAFHQLLREVQLGRRPADDPEALVAGLVVTHKRWERGGQSPGFASWFHQDDEILGQAVRALGYLPPEDEAGRSGSPEGENQEGEGKAAPVQPEPDRD